MSSIMEVRGLSAGYGRKTVVDGVDFTLEERTLTGLLGSNGSGKTTLAKAVCGLITSTGEVNIAGRDPRHEKSKARASLISYIPQRSEIAFSMPVLDVVLMGFYPVLGPLESPGKQMRLRAMEALTSVGLEAKAQEDYLTLSGGQKQMVILARAMVRDTPLYLFDEPDSALDFANHHRALEYIKGMSHRAKMAGLICIHDANFALRYCDRLIFLNGGKTVAKLDLHSAGREEIESALCSIYGPVELLLHKGHYMVDKKEET